MVNDVSRPRDLEFGETGRLSGLFGAMASPARRVMLRRLARGEAIVSELAAPLEMSAPAVSRHLRVLEQAGLVDRRREGRTHYIRLQRSAFAPAADFMADFWTEAFDALEQHMDQPVDE
jgi:DNA-binding transcriptional ArsR family regulator